jgi:hypothetical protein
VKSRSNFARFAARQLDGPLLRAMTTRKRPKKIILRRNKICVPHPLSDNERQIRERNQYPLPFTIEQNFFQRIFDHPLYRALLHPI